MGHMFRGAAAFNQPLAAWDVSKVENMRGMFRGAAAFNQPLAAWDVSKVTGMDGMFYECPVLPHNKPVRANGMS